MRVIRLLPLVLILFCVGISASAQQKSGDGADPILLDADLTFDENQVPVLKVEIPQHSGALGGSGTGSLIRLTFPLAKILVGEPGAELEPGQAADSVTRTFLKFPAAKQPQEGLFQGLVISAGNKSWPLEEFFVPERSEDDGEGWSLTLALVAFAMMALLFCLILVILYIRWPGLLAKVFPSPRGAEEEKIVVEPRGKSGGHQNYSMFQGHPDVHQGLEIEEMMNGLTSQVRHGFERIATLISTPPSLGNFGQPFKVPLAIEKSSDLSSLAGELKNFKLEVVKEIGIIVHREVRVAMSASASHLHVDDREFIRQLLERALREGNFEGGRSQGSIPRGSMPGEESSKALVPIVSGTAVFAETPPPSGTPRGPVRSETAANSVTSGIALLTENLADVLAAWPVRIEEANPSAYVRALKGFNANLSTNVAFQGLRIWFARISEGAGAQSWLIQEVLAVDEDKSPLFRSIEGTAIISEHVWQVMLAISEEGRGRHPERVALLFAWSRLEKGAPAIWRHLADWTNSALRPELVRCVRPAWLEWSDKAAGYMVSRKLSLTAVDRESGEVSGQ